MAHVVKERSLGRNFLWCADLQSDLKEALYIDKVHYSGEFSKRITGTIGN